VNGPEELEVQAGSNKVKFRTYSLQAIAIVLILMVSAAGGTVLYQHVQATDRQIDRFISAISELSRSQRELTCIITYPENIRESKVEFCKRMARW
jgi:hypothetical protein